MTEGPVITLKVTHLGPSVDDIGGMSSVIRASLTPRPGVESEALASYALTAPLWGLSLFLRCVWQLVRRSRARIGTLHVHLSQRGSYVREGALIALAALRRVPVVVTIHGSSGPAFLCAHPRLVRTVLRPALRIAVLGDRARQRAATVLPAAKLVILTNVVPLADDVTPPAFDGSPTALFAGEVGPRKGFDVLLQAWPLVLAAVPTARLLVAGPQLAPPVPTAGVTYLGPLAHPAVLAVLETEAWVAVLPSRHEGLPMFLLEAMSRARPVVATDVGEVAALVSEVGVLLQVGDPVGLAAGLVRYLSDADVARQDGATGRNRLQQAHSPATNAEQLDRLYGVGAPASQP